MRCPAVKYKRGEFSLVQIEPVEVIEAPTRCGSPEDEDASAKAHSGMRPSWAWALTARMHRGDQAEGVFCLSDALPGGSGNVVEPGIIQERAFAPSPGKHEKPLTNSCECGRLPLLRRRLI
eukprot:scaffold162906_cov36-Tisochrysis_lutea.AAC.5